MLERQLDHLAHLTERFTEAAEVIVGDGRGPLLLELDELGHQLDFRLLRDLHDTARRGRDHAQTNLLQPERRLLEEHAEQVVRHAAGLHLAALIDRCRDDVAGYQRSLEQRAAQHLAGADQAEVLLRGSELNATGGLRVGLLNGDMIANADARVAALQAIQPDHIQAFVFRIRWQCECGRGTLAGDFNDVAFVQTELLHGLLAQARRAGPHVLRLGPRYL